MECGGPFSKCSPLIAVHWFVSKVCKWHVWGSPNRILIFTLHSWKNTIPLCDLVGQRTSYHLPLTFLCQIKVHSVSLWGEKCMRKIGTPITCWRECKLRWLRIFTWENGKAYKVGLCSLYCISNRLNSV